MKILVRPELPTASVGSSQATTAAVDNSAPLATRSESTYKSGKVVQTNGATSHLEWLVQAQQLFTMCEAVLRTVDTGRDWSSMDLARQD